MALSRTDYTPSVSSGSFGTGGYTSTSFTPPNNSLLIVVGRGVAVASDSNGSSANFNLTNSAGLTFTPRKNVDGAGGIDTYGERVWTAPVTTGASMTVSIDTTIDVAMYGWSFEIFAYTGYDTSTPVGATTSGTDADGNGPASITLDAAPASTSEVLGLLMILTDTGFVAPTPGSGFTEIHDAIGWDGWVTAESESRTGSTSTSVAWADLNTSGISLDACMCAIEIRAAGGSTSLDAAAAGAASATGALTTQIRAAAAATDVATASAALTTAIRLAMAAVSNAAASGALTTQIKLAGAASDVASASANLSTGAVMQAAAADVASAVAGLTTAIQLGGSAVDTAVATGALTSWASVVLSGVLYTGEGGVLDSNFWVDDVPTLGTTIYYDPTHLTIYPNAEISADTNNCAAVVQFLGPNGWALGLIVVTPQMVAVAADSASASGQLTTAIRLAAAASALATATAAFSTGAGLTAAASDTAAAGGALATQIPLSALASDVVTAVGALTTQIKLAASATSQSSASADLNGIIVLNAAGAALSSMTGGLTTAIRAAATASDTAGATGALSTSILLSGAAQDTVNAAAALATSIALGGVASNAVTATGNLTTARNLVAAAIDMATAVATISTGIRLDAHAASISEVSAELSGFVRLLADAAAESTATAELTDVITNPPIGAYASDPRFYIHKPRWSFFSNRRTPRFDEKDPLEGVVLTFDLSAAMAADEYLNGPITLTIAATSGSDASPRSLLVGVPSYDMTKRKILQPVTAGIDGNTYYVKVSAKTNVANRVVALAGLLPVRG